MMLLLLWAGALAICFFFIGQNQIEFDEITDTKVIKYGTVGESIWFIVDIILGNYDRESFEAGKNPS